MGNNETELFLERMRFWRGAGHRVHKARPLLRQVGMIMLYYHLFRLARAQGWNSDITRKRLVDFDKLRESNRRKAEQDLTKANYDLIEFDRYAQSPNDGYAIRFRLKVLLRDVFRKEVSADDL